MSEVTKHFIIDLKSGFVYGIKLDAEGNCKAVQPLTNSIETLEGRGVTKFGPVDPAENPGGILPYGKTTYCVELTQDGKPGKFFTIVWPQKDDADKGTLPVVAQKDLPDDLIKAGIAPRPKVEKGDAVNDDEVLKTALKNIDSMIGLETAKRDIRQNIAVARFNRMKEELGLSTKSISRHMVFTGNPGTGKTTFAREVAKVYQALGFIEKAEVHEVKREDLVAGFVGQTALKTKEQIEKAKGGVLFIDEAYALSRDGGGGADSGSKDFGREAIDTLVAAMENMRENLIVIVAGYPEPMKKFIDANEGLKSRFMTYINFDDYNLPELGKIMDFMLEERGYKMDTAAHARALELIGEEQQRAKKDFGNGRTVRNLVEKAEKELALRLEEEGILSRTHGLSEADLKARLTTLTLDDINRVSLQGLSAKGTGKDWFNFEAAKPAIPAGNDNPPASSLSRTAATARPPAGSKTKPGAGR